MDTKAPVPFKTTEPILALCLRMVGVPMFVPPMNVYDRGILARLGYRGTKLREAAIEADRQKQRGRVEFYFEKTPELDYFLKVFAEQEKEINEEGNDMDAGERIRQIMALATRPPEDRPDIPGPLMDEREATIRVLCIGLKMRPRFLAQWTEWTSFLDVTKDAQPPEELGLDSFGRKRVRFHPGLKRVPVNASDAMLKKLNLL